MFVRWQSRKRRIPEYGGWGERVGRWPLHVITRAGTSEQDVHWSAILVESARVDGKPTQRHIASLGGITDSGIAIIHQRCWFWDHVMERLDHLANRVSADERKQIERSIALKVSRPTKREYDRCVRDGLKWLGDIEEGGDSMKAHRPSKG